MPSFVINLKIIYDFWFYRSEMQFGLFIYILFIF